MWYTYRRGSGVFFRLGCAEGRFFAHAHAHAHAHAYAHAHAHAHAYAYAYA